MAKFLAVDWDESECRYAVATIQNTQITIRDAGIVHIEDEEFDSPLTALSIALHTHCKEMKLGSCPLLISLGRNEIEWLQQKLPPCKETEIPMLLRNQVLREIAHSTESDPLDYLILDTTSEGHQILALTISQTYQKTLTRTFRSLGYPPLRVGFRACNAAELLLRNPTLIVGEFSETCLVVNTVGNDVDLITIAGSVNGERRIVAVRSFRLPVEQQQKHLADEIERTLTIGLEGDTTSSIQHIVLFGDETDTKLHKLLSRSNLSIQFLNPFTLPNVSTAKNISDPERFAPLVGSLIVQSQKAKQGIDFLHPKEAPQPPNYTRPVLLAFVFLTLVCFGLYSWNHLVISRMETELAAVKEEHQKVVSEIQQLSPSYQVLWGTQGWENQNVPWLDVLKDLSEVLPSSTDLAVDRLVLTTGSNNPRFTGSIVLSGMVREPAVLMKLQSNIQASRRYQMQYQTPRPNPAGGGYPWFFSITIYRLR